MHSYPLYFRGRLLVSLVPLLVLTAQVARAVDPVSPPTSVLTTAAEVRALSAEEAKRGVSVRLRGVVMGEADPVSIAFVMQDGTEGIYIQGPAEAVMRLQRGDEVEVRGQSDPGGFAPYVVAEDVRVIGHGRIPEPIPVSLQDLDAGRMDAKWVEFTGIVHALAPKTASDAAPPPPGTRYASVSAPVDAADPLVKLLLSSGNSRVAVQIHGALRPEDYVDAEVRIRGLCFNLHNHNRQFVGPFIQVPRGVPVEILRAPPVDPFNSAPSPVSSLLQFAQLAGELGHRVHVRGVVVHYQPGSGLWIREGDRSLRVDTTHLGELKPGDEVDVVGFPARGEYSAVLEDALFRKRADKPVPEPHRLRDPSDALQHDAGLVQLDAHLTEIVRFPDTVSLTLEWENTTVRAKMRREKAEGVPSGWLAGSRVRVSGVCSVLTDSGRPLGGLWEPSAFELLLRSPADLVVVQPPPWWNAQRVVWVLSGFLALALGAVALVSFLSRRRTKDQEYRRAMAEAEFTAILNERNRVAREIHDTLSQSLGAISVQLELARVHANDISAPARNHLAVALKLVRAALAEARDSIWNMRSHVLEKRDLADALEGILNRMTEGTAIRPAMQVDGTRRRLSPMVENNLLRIGQEAITNATNHAKPTRITVTLSFEGRRVRLAVEDDGGGFAVDHLPESERGHFGLIGIRERAELLGGQAEIASEPGKGTRVEILVVA